MTDGNLRGVCNVSIFLNKFSSVDAFDVLESYDIVIGVASIQSCAKIAIPMFHIVSTVDFAKDSVHCYCCYSKIDEEMLMEITDVSFSNPGEKCPLVSRLSYKVMKFSNTIVTGNSSSGKTSLFRVLKGLWPVKSGHIKCRFPSLPYFVFYLPQKPLLTDGTLRQQIVYPLDPVFMTTQYCEEDEKLFRYLKLADLWHIWKRVGGLDTPVDWNWYDVLSPGEMQRLSFVRLFYHKPVLAFLDEATSAIGYEMEEILYNFCNVLGITVFTIGHRKSLIGYHSVQLHISGRGKWTLSKIYEK